MEDISSISERRYGPWLTLNEVSVLSRVPESKIRDELDAGVVPRRRHARSSSLAFKPRDTFFFRLLVELPVALDPRLRRELYVLLWNGAQESASWRRTESGFSLVGSIPVHFDTSGVLPEVISRIRLYVQGKHRIESRSGILGGEPVFKGTRVAVRHVGALVKRGVSRLDLLADFPALTRDDLEFAEVFCELNRPAGRPRKPLQLRRQDA